MSDGTRSGHNRVDTIIASAGTGKTYALVERIKSAVNGGLAPDRLLATTFTKRAAAELAGRIRSKLVEEGRPDLAVAMLTARIGTVNGVCGSLIAEFAFELGRYPVTEVIAEDRQKPVFERAMGVAMSRLAGAIQPVAERLDIPAQGYHDARGKVDGWQDAIRRIVDLARSNGVPPERLAECAEHSVAGLARLLPEPGSGETADGLDRALRDAVADCMRAIAARRGTLKKGTLDKDVPASRRPRRSWPAAGACRGSTGPGCRSSARRRRTRGCSPSSRPPPPPIPDIRDCARTSAASSASSSNAPRSACAITPSTSVCVASSTLSIRRCSRSRSCAIPRTRSGCAN